MAPPIERKCLLVADNPTDITQLLRAVSAGDATAFERLMPHVYDTLKRIAHWQLQAGNASLCTTELVHEAYLKLTPGASQDWQGRAHFYAVAARAMRQVLVDLARRRRVDHRWRERALEHADPARGVLDTRLEHLIALNDALDGLSRVSQRLRLIVEYRYFGGMNEADIARVLGVSTRTVERDWIKARLWLHQELFPG